MSPRSDTAPGVSTAISAGRFRARRESLLTALGDGVAVVSAAPELFRSGDGEVPYRPDSNMFYLTGFPESEAVAVFTPHSPDQRFTLFVLPREPEREVWTGERVGVERAAERYGADAVYPIDELAGRLADLVRPADRIFYPVGAEPAFDERMIALLVRARRTSARSGLGPTALVDLNSVLAGMRRTKDEGEIELMREAARIGTQGQRDAIARVRHGAGEWEIEAALEATMRSSGATGPAFPSIVGSGRNSTVLHYSANTRRVEDGDLVLIDSGAEWGMYCSDITRTVPASGRFTGAQRELYDIVLAAEKAGIAAAVPGAPVSAVHDAAVRVLTDGMLRTGLLTGMELDEAIETLAYRLYYMHQTSHWLGLDVHDVGVYRENGAPVALEPGMVLTVEPGLYVSADALDAPERFRGIGIRIEDTVLVTATGNEVLTRDVPTAADEIEALVGSGFGP